MSRWRFRSPERLGIGRLEHTRGRRQARALHARIEPLIQADGFRRKGPLLPGARLEYGPGRTYQLCLLVWDWLRRHHGDRERAPDAKPELFVQPDRAGVGSEDV